MVHQSNLPARPVWGLPKKRVPNSSPGLESHVLINMTCILSVNPIPGHTIKPYKTCISYQYIIHTVTYRIIHDDINHISIKCLAVHPSLFIFVGSLAPTGPIQGPKLTTGLAQADIPREGREVERCNFGSW